MQHLKRVTEFVVLNRPWPICEDCIAEKLDISASGPQDLGLEEVALMPSFVRERAGCRFCRQIKDVIRFG